MTKITDTTMPALLCGEAGFDPIEDRLRQNIRATIGALSCASSGSRACRPPGSAGLPGCSMRNWRHGATALWARRNTSSSTPGTRRCATAGSCGTVRRTGKRSGGSFSRRTCSRLSASVRTSGGVFRAFPWPCPRPRFTGGASSRAWSRAVCAASSSSCRMITLDCVQPGAPCPEAPPGSAASSISRAMPSIPLRTSRSASASEPSCAPCGTPARSPGPKPPWPS